MNYFKKWDNIVGWFAFGVAALIYILSMEPTTSLWDCAEFIATSYKLEVGHPPGAPLFMIIARLFTALAPSPSDAAMMVNLMSSLASAATVLFTFWTISHLALRIFQKSDEEISQLKTWTILGASFIGSIAYAVTDTFWFSAIEGEVYALSSMFTAVVFWAILKWENVADQPHANRWLVLIAYLMGLSIGVHILNLLCIPAIVFIYYFKKSSVINNWGIIKATAISFVILGAIYIGVISWSVAIGAWFDRVFVNTLSLPVNSGMLFYVIALFALCIWAIYYTHNKGKVLANTLVLCFTMLILGYSSYASVVIRASVNPPMNSNDPSNPYALLSLLNRDQYGSRPLLFGPAYSSPPIDVEEKTTYYLDEDGKYKKDTYISGYKYPSEFTFFFPRMYSYSDSDIEAYKSWADIKGRNIRYDDEVINVPTMGENLKYFFGYQLNFMYWRYFLWNFVGRQSDIQSTGEITNGNWLSGIEPIDALYLGPQSNLPSEMEANKGRNRYFFLPFILGVLGILYQLKRDKRNFVVVMWLFFMLGIALVLYFNTPPSEPRERDYIFAGSFYAFSIWIGLGVLWVAEKMAKLFKSESAASVGLAILISFSVPKILLAENWDDHNRSRRYTTRDLGYNYLQTALPNSIVMNYGDNDTFPLWYNQEVEGVRPDVKIMNMSYLGADWYIDQMKVKSNDADPVPFSLPSSKYTNKNDYVYLQDINNGKPLELKTVMDFVKSDDERTQVEVAGNRTDFIPAKKFALPVNKQNAIESGIVKAEDAHLMVDTIYFEINKSAVDKSELMLLDLLANFDWKRPLFFTQSYSLANIGLRDYLQQDGYGYRFVPIKTPVETMLETGRIDADCLYNNLMNVYKYGNIKDPRVYADAFIHTSNNSVQSRNLFARLAKELVKRGEKEKAIEVLDYGIEEIPFNQIRHSYVLTIPIIEAYYEAEAFEKGDSILNDYATILKEYIQYYGQFSGAKAAMIASAMNENLSYLSELYSISNDYNREAIKQDLETFFKAIQ